LILGPGPQHHLPFSSASYPLWQTPGRSVPCFKHFWLISERLRSNRYSNFQKHLTRSWPTQLHSELTTCDQASLWHTPRVVNYVHATVDQT
jgi:hypothetical protein